jgi:ketosteroid isomerase-like protein
MKWRLLICSLLVSKSIFSQEKNDSTQIIQLLKDDYKTMVSNDIKTHMANCTDDYLLIENGEIWNMTREAEDYRKNANRVIERNDHFEFKYIKILENTAYTVYTLNSDIKENGKLKTLTWNESVIFRKIKGHWKIALIHSTKIEP